MKRMECEVKKQESKSFVKKELNEIKDGKKANRKSSQCMTDQNNGKKNQDANSSQRYKGIG